MIDDRQRPRRPAIMACLTLGVILAVLLGGCAQEGDFKLPGVYRIDIQQGNVIEQDMLRQLKPGMDKNQVRLILGTPVLVDPFHSNRWEYVYTLSQGGQVRQQWRLTAYFEDEKLAYVEGDVVPGAAPDALTEPGKQARTVDVPLQREKGKGFLRNVFGLLPFIRNEDEARATNKAAKPGRPRQEDEAD